MAHRIGNSSKVRPWLARVLAFSFALVLLLALPVLIHTPNAARANPETVIVPIVSVAKSGARTTAAGQIRAYTLTVTNTSTLSAT